MSRQAMNIRGIQAREKAKDFKSRQGGISQEAWKDISKDERKEFAKDGLMPSTWQEGNFGESGRDKFSSNQKIWETAAYEHGFGNVRDSDDLRKLHSSFKETGIKKMDSFNDARQFRRAHNDFDDKRFKAIEGKLDKQDSAPKQEAEPEQPKKDEGPVEHSDHYANAIDTVSNYKRTDWSKGYSNSSSNNQGNFGSSFMNKYKSGVKDNQEPKPSPRPSWKSW